MKLQEDVRVYLKTLGCRLNEAELERWAYQFSAGGHHVVDKESDADVVVLNTCAVTQEAVRKSRQTLNRLHRDNPVAKLIATGCCTTLAPDQAAQAMGVDLVVPNTEKDRLPELVSRALQIPSMTVAAAEPGAASLFARNRSRAFVKVQDGCRYRCTFCIVTVARGEERSRPTADIIDEINRLVEGGVQEAVLTGVHVGGYGSDLGTGLYQLITAILAETNLPRLRLASVEPWDLPEGFFSLFENQRLMPHIHLPLQSGADSVLRRMARRCKTNEFAALVETARTAVPDFNVTTDIIVGFPGETEEEWRQTLAFVERIGFGHLHIFTYSPRAGTKAASLPNPVNPNEQRRRSRELHALGARMKRETLQRIIGREVPVLWERRVSSEPDQAPRVIGYTPNYLRVYAETKAQLSASPHIAPARLAHLTSDDEALWAVRT